MTRFQKIAPLALLAIAPLLARAELVWTPDKGWEAKDGLIADYQGLSSERKTALSLMNEARKAQEDERWFSALSSYNEVIDDYPGSEFEAEALYQKGVIHLRRSQFERAFTDFHTIVEKHPEFPRHSLVVQGQYDVAMSIKRGERPWLWGWIPWFKDNEKGLEFFEKTYEAAPYGVRAELSLFNKGEWGREIDKEEDAIDAYERLIYRYPDSILAPHAYIAMAELYAGRVMGPHWDQGSTRDALNFYRDFVALFPKDPYAPEAQKKVVELNDTLARNRLELGKFYYYRRNNGRAASIFLNEAVNAAPDSEAAKEAQDLLAKVRADEPPPRTLLDWIFGRYPKSDAGDFVDAQSQQNLETMGFRSTRHSEVDAPAPEPEKNPGR